MSSNTQACSTKWIGSIKAAMGKLLPTEICHSIREFALAPHPLAVALVTSDEWACTQAEMANSPHMTFLDMFFCNVVEWDLAALDEARERRLGLKSQPDQDRDENLVSFLESLRGFRF